MVRYMAAAGFVLFVGSVASVGVAAAGVLESCTDGSAAASNLPQLKIRTGLERHRVWLAAEYDGLQINKFTEKGGSSVIDFRYGDDQVVFEVAPGRGVVNRRGTRLEVTGRDPDAVLRLLGDSAAMFHTRTMLSRLEGESALRAPEMSLLSAAALAASLTGDAMAPMRLSARFVALHRGIVKRVRDDESCWEAYASETLDAMDDGDACIAEAWQGSYLLISFREAACKLIWFLRAESAWFEFLACISPLSLVK